MWNQSHTDSAHLGSQKRGAVSPTVCEKNRHVWLPQGHLLQMNLLSLRQSYLVVTSRDSVDRRVHRCAGSWALWLTLLLNKMPLNKGYWQLSLSVHMCARVCVSMCIQI